MVDGKVLDAVCQLGVLLSALATFLLARKNKWGWVLGLCSQPFWLTTAYLNNQWGVFINSTIFTFVWVYGAYKWFREAEIISLLTRIDHETKYSSNPNIALRHPSFKALVAKGHKAIAPALHLLPHYPNVCMCVLTTITTSIPFKNEDKGNVPAMVFAWLEWGKREGYLG